MAARRYGDLPSEEQPQIARCAVIAWSTRVFINCSSTSSLAVQEGCALATVRPQVFAAGRYRNDPWIERFISQKQQVIIAFASSESNCPRARLAWADRFAGKLPAQSLEEPRVAAQTVASPNFDFLPQREALLVQLGTLAERYFLDDPNTALLKLRQFGEVTAQRAAAHAGIFVSTDEGQSELLRRLRSRGCR